jgi:glutamate formiminotransferase
MGIIECVPNVSEVRRPEHVAAMAEALVRVGGARLLDVSSDASHNRSVFTLAGDDSGLLAAIDALFASATRLVDLRTHRGEHPRIGAVDVVPFVPISGVSMTDCVALARAAGEMMAARYGVPVFLYGEAATAPVRRRLEHLRRGGAEALAARMRSPEWTPDFGPAAPHVTAGVTAIGARRALIAYNVNLGTGDVRIAKAIAARVREANGGLPCVKALGFLLAERGTAQVSMNLTDFNVTPIERVFDAVARYADEAGVTIVESELVGLIPAAALANTTPEHLKLRDFSSDRILEERLRAKGFSLPA